MTSRKLDMQVHIIPLSQNLVSSRMETLALETLGIDYDQVKILKEEHRRPEHFNREILITWKRQNPSDNEIAVSDAQLFYFKKTKIFCRIV